MAVQKTATVTRLTPFSAASTLVEFATPAGAPLGFVGGQYIIVNAGSPGPGQREMKRAYSILSSDADQTRFELSAQLLPGGFGSAYLNVLEVGQEISFSGPWGKLAAGLPTPVPCDAAERWVIATDTGITAALGLVRGAALAAVLPNTKLLWMRDPNDAFLSASFVRESVPVELGCVTVMSMPPVGHQDRMAMACAALSSWLQEGMPGQAFLAGDGKVTLGLTALLVQAGLPAEALRTEMFFNKPT